MTRSTTTCTVADPHEDQPCVPWGPLRGVAATLALAGAVALTLLAAHTAADGLPAVDRHITAFTFTLGALLGALAGWTVTCAWHSGGDTDYAAHMFIALCFAVSIAAILTGHGGASLLPWLPLFAFSVLTWLPANPITYLETAWWTPIGAYRRGEAQGALDAAAHAHALLADPRLDCADAEQLVAVFERDARAVAAEALGDARDIHLGNQVVCSVCARSTAEQPCPHHQPALYAVHHDDAD